MLDSMERYVYMCILYYWHLGNFLKIPVFFVIVNQVLVYHVSECG